MYAAPHRTVYRRRQPSPKSTPLLKRLPLRKALILAAGALMVVIIALTLLGRGRDNGAPSPAASQPAKQTASQPAIAGRSTTAVSFDMTRHSTTDPKSIWLVVNKKRPLDPKSYAPADLVVPNIALRPNITSTEKYVRADMAKALEKMVSDAAAAGVHFNLQSGYRSYSFQVTLYNGYVASQGQAVADRQSARPGYSEHQTGLAADLGGTSQPSCDVEACYADTVEGKWLAANAYTYGFIIRYPADKEPVTGYLYEPWHIRYIGTELAAELHSQDSKTLEEFFSTGAAPSY